MNESIDTLLDELSSFNYTPATQESKPRVKSVEVTEDNITEFVIKSSEELINTGLETVADLKEYIIQGQNPDEIDALANLINSTTGAIEALNKMALLKKKNEAAKELKVLELENRKEIARLLPQSNIVNNTNVVVASREEVLKKLILPEKTIEIEENDIVLIPDKSE
jgi:hypothetical protein